MAKRKLSGRDLLETAARQAVVVWSEDIAQAVLQLRNKSDAERSGMGANGRQFYEKALSFNTGVTVFEDIFSSLIRPDHP